MFTKSLDKTTLVYLFAIAARVQRLRGAVSASCPPSSD